MTILVKYPPSIIPMPACPTTLVRIIGYGSGYTLRVRSYDMFTNQLIGESTQNITSSDQEFTVVWATPQSRTIILAVLEVVDANGNVVEKWQQPFIYVPNASISNIQASDVAYVSKVGGITKYQSSTSTLVLDPMLIAIVRRQGYLAIYDGTLKREFTGKSAFVELTFSVPTSIARMLGNYVDDPAVVSVVYKVPELLDYLGAIVYTKQLLESLRLKLVAITPSKTDNVVNIKVTTYVDLYSSFDWGRVIQILAGVGAILAGALVLIGSYGVSAPISVEAFVIGFSLVVGGVAIGTALIESPTAISQQAGTIAETSKKEIDTYTADLNAYVDSLVSQGKITSDEANTIKNYVNNIVTSAKEAIDELKDLVDKAYKEGYNKGVSDSMMWIAIAGISGLAVGTIISRK